MKVYLDDVRDTPEGWTRCFWPDEVIVLLKTGQVEELSLDHDLGEDERTGYDVIKWMEEQVYTTDFVPPAIIHVHSANSGAWSKMKSGIEQIRKIYQQKRGGE